MLLGMRCIVAVIRKLVVVGMFDERVPAQAWVVEAVIERKDDAMMLSSWQRQCLETQRSC